MCAQPTLPVLAGLGLTHRFQRGVAVESTENGAEEEGDGEGAAGDESDTGGQDQDGDGTSVRPGWDLLGPSPPGEGFPPDLPRLPRQASRVCPP